MKDLVFLTRAGCVNTTTMRANLDAALRLAGQPSQYQVIDLETLPDGDARRGYPTPTVLVSNRDLFGMAEPQPLHPTPTRRIYPDGIPSAAAIQDRLKRPAASG